MPSLSPQAQAIYDLIHANRTGTSFIEVTTAFRQAGYNPDGGLAIEHPAVEQMLMWGGVSDDLLAAVNELLGARLIHYTPTSVLVYLADGGMMPYPLAERMPKNRKFAKPHWIPMVLNDGPAPA
jgi:hypothetical protein